MVLDALFGVGPPPPLCSCRPHRTFVPLLPSSKAYNAIVQVERRSMRSWYSMPFFSVRPPPLLCSRRPHRTFIPLSPSCRAIVRVDTRSLCANGLIALSNIGRDEALTERGAHSLSLRCGATAMAFCQASAEVIKDVGRWNSDAYLRYIRERDYMSYMTRICSADVDDMEADHLDLDAHDLDDSDYV